MDHHETEDAHMLFVEKGDYYKVHMDADGNINLLLKDWPFE